MDSGILLSKRIKKATYKDATVMVMSTKRKKILVLLRGNRLIKKILLKNLRSAYPDYIKTRRP